MKKSLTQTEIVERIYKQESKVIGINVPLIITEEDNNVVASCNYMISKRFLTVVGIEDATDVTVNMPCLIRQFNNMVPKILRAAAFKWFVLVVIRHELRHVWQTMYNKPLLLDTCGSFNLDMINGYGLRPQEADANEYALQAPATQFGKFIMESFVMNQGTAGKAFLTSSQETAITNYYRTTAKYVALRALGLFNEGGMN